MRKFFSALMAVYFCMNVFAGDEVKSLTFIGCGELEVKLKSNQLKKGISKEDILKARSYNQIARHARSQDCHIAVKKINGDELGAGTCKFSSDVSVSTIHLKKYLKTLNDKSSSCQSGTGACIPEIIYLCVGTVICNNDMEFKSKNLRVSCFSDQGICPPVQECLRDTSTVFETQIHKDFKNTYDIQLEAAPDSKPGFVIGR